MSLAECLWQCSHNACSVELITTPFPLFLKKTGPETQEAAKDELVESMLKEDSKETDMETDSACQEEFEKASSESASLLEADTVLDELISSWCGPV